MASPAAASLLEDLDKGVLGVGIREHDYFRADENVVCEGVWEPEGREAPNLPKQMHVMVQRFAL